MKKAFLFVLALAVLVAGGFGGSMALAEKEREHRIVFQVNEPDKIGLTLNNAMNVIQSLGPGNVELEIVAYGPGLAMFHKSSKVQKRLQALHAFGNVKFAVCGNTMKKLKYTKKDLLSDAFVQEAVVPGGVVRIMELQEAGYTYIRP